MHDRPSFQFTHRLAQAADKSAIVELMRASITENMKAFLSPREIEAARETMGVDQTLLEDQTYFVIETLVDGVAPSPNLLFVLSQNKFESSCKTFPVPSNKTRPTVPEAIGVVPIVKPEPLKMFEPVKDFVS